MITFDFESEQIPRKGLSVQCNHIKMKQPPLNEPTAYLPTYLRITFHVLPGILGEILQLYLFLKKWAIPDLFLVYFRLFKQTIQFLQQIDVKKYPSSIRCWDLNPRPSEDELPPITTKPGLSPIIAIFYSIFLSWDCLRSPKCLRKPFRRSENKKLRC